MNTVVECVTIDLETRRKKKGFKKYKNKINTFNLNIKCFEAIPQYVKY